MADPTQPNIPDDTDAPEPTGTDVDTSDTSPQAIADKNLPKGTPLHGAVASGGITLTSIGPDGLYNNVHAPIGAKFVSGGNWVTEKGQIMPDVPVNPDGSVNEHSSAYVSNMRESMLDSGINPIMVDKLMKPIYDGAKATQDMINNTSDKLLSQVQANQTIKSNQQAIQKNQAELQNTYNTAIAEAYSGGSQGGTDPQSVQAGTKAASQVLGQFISMINSADASGKQAQQFFPQMFKPDGSMDPAGLQPTIQTAVSQGAAAAQQAQATLASTRTGQSAVLQNMAVQRFESGEQAVGSLEAGNNAVISSATTANKAQTALQLFDQLRTQGAIGGPYQNILRNIQGIIQQNGPNAGAAQELKAYLSTDNLSSLKSALGQRLAASEFNAISPTQINPNWQASSIHDFLTNVSRYSQADLQNKKSTQNGIISNVKRQNLGVDTSPYESQLNSAEQNTQTNKQRPEKPEPLAPPSNNMSQVQFYQWAGDHNIPGANLEKAWNRYQTQVLGK